MIPNNEILRVYISVPPITQSASALQTLEVYLKVNNLIHLLSSAPGCSSRYRKFATPFQLHLFQSYLLAFYDTLESLSRRQNAIPKYLLSLVQQEVVWRLTSR